MNDILSIIGTILFCIFGIPLILVLWYIKSGSVGGILRDAFGSSDRHYHHYHSKGKRRQ